MRARLKHLLRRAGLFAAAREAEQYWNVLRRRIHDPEFRALPRSIDGGAIADVGANLGQSVISLRTLFPASPIFAFEPNPGCARVLGRVARLCGGDVRITRCGVGNAPSTLRFLVPVLDDGTELLQEGSFDEAVFAEPITAARIGRSYSLRALDVPVVTLDDLNQRFALLKIDVQGFELQVLEGAAAILRRDRPVVIVERDARVEARIREWMDGLGYTATTLAMNTIFAPRAEPGAPRG